MNRQQYSYAQHAKLLNEQNRLQNLLEANNLQQQQQYLEQKAESCDWEKLDEAAKVIASVQHAFEKTDCEMNEFGNSGDNNKEDMMAFQVKLLIK